MLSINIIVFIVVSVTILTSTANEQKINVLVLYESLCPDSINFMKNQLGPNYDSLKDYISITLVPFGKSESLNNGGQFSCQHGPAECEGNRLQSCVLHQTSNQETQVKYVICQMSGKYEATSSYCAELVGLSGHVEECVNTDLGTILQLEAERITQQYSPSFVPTIIYDGIFDQQLQDSSLTNFKGVVCSLLQKRGTNIYNSDC